MKSFKRALSVTMTVMMIISICTVIFLMQGSAQIVPEPTLNTIGVEPQEVQVYDFRDYTGTKIEADSTAYVGANNYEFPDTATLSNGDVTIKPITGDQSLWDSSVGGVYRYLVRMYLRDKDVNGGDYLRIESGKTYGIRVEYSVADTAAANSTISVGVSYGTTRDGRVYALGGYDAIVNDCVGQDFEVTYTINGDDACPATKYVSSTATNTLAELQDFAGKYVAIVVAKNSEVVIRKVTVNIYDNTQLLDSNGVAVDFSNGLADVYMPSGSVTNAGYLDGYRKSGNLNGYYKIVDDPTNSGKGQVLAVNFNGTNADINFGLPESKGLGTWSSGTAASGTAKDAHFRGQGFKLTAGRTYRITFDISANGRSGEEISNIYVRRASAATVGTDGTKPEQLSVKTDDMIKNIAATAKKSNWVTVSADYTPTDTAEGTVANFPYLIIGMSFTGNATVYFDNITVKDVTDEGSTDGSVVLNAEGGLINGSVDNVHMNVTNGETYALPTPKKEGYLFAGWTKSYSFANGNMTNRSREYWNTISNTYYTTGIVTSASETANKTFIIGEAGNQVYYAIWLKKDYTLNLGVGETRYLLDSSGECYTSKWSGYSNSSQTLTFSNLAGSVTTTSSQRFYVGEWNEYFDEPYYLYDGVTYKVTVNVSNVAADNSGNFPTLRLGRAEYLTYSYTRFDETFTLSASSTKVEFTFTASGIYNGGTSALKNTLALFADTGSFTVNSITIEPVVYAGALEREEGTLKVDSDNGTVTVIPNPGYTVKADSLKISDNRKYSDSVGSSAAVGNATVSGDIYSLRNSDSRFIYHYSGLNSATLLEEMAFDVGFIEDTSKVSIRHENTEGESYVSAGIRFRLTVAKTVKEQTSEMGFVVTPVDLIESAYGDIFTVGTKITDAIERGIATKAVVFDGANNIYYNDNGDSFDYQVVLTGLTREGETANLLNNRFSALFYTVIGGETEYYFVRTASYNDVLAIYEELERGPVEDVTIAGTSIEEYKIVIPDYNSSYLVTTAIEDFNNKLFEISGFKVPVVADSSNASMFEIIIDNCNREGVNTSQAKQNYEVRQDGTKIFVNGGQNYSTAYAVRQLTALLSDNGGEIVANESGTYNMSTDLDGYTLVWQDEFDTLSTDTWTITNNPGASWYGGWYGRTTYRSNKPENLKAQNGKLYITPTYDDNYFYGAYMTTANSVNFTKGYMEISARVADGQGVWHDFWTWSNEKEHIEFDIMECWGGAHRYVNFIHEFTINPANTSSTLDTEVAFSYVTKNSHVRNQHQTYESSFINDPANSMNAEFHTFGCEWTDEKVIMSRDGEITFEYTFAGTDTAYLYEKPHYFILSMLVGSNYSNYTPEEADQNNISIKYPLLDGDYWGNDKGSFIVEYCQLYQKPGQYLELK